MTEQRERTSESRVAWAGVTLTAIVMFASAAGIYTALNSSIEVLKLQQADEHAWRTTTDQRIAALEREGGDLRGDIKVIKAGVISMEQELKRRP